MSSNTRTTLFLIGALILVVVLIGGAGSDGPPLDPRSVNPDGARGLVEVLEQVGARVDIDEATPRPGASTAIMLQDRLSSSDEAIFGRWIRDGGVLVVADLSSSFAQPRAGFAPNPIRRERCDIDVLRDAQLVEVRGSSLDTDGFGSCFGDGDKAFVVARPLGAGTVVTVGGPTIFTNEFLDEDDAAVIAVSLLAPERDDSHVTFVRPSIVEFGEDDFTEIVAPRTSNFVVQLLAAFLLYALYHGRRLGAVVPEPVPVHIEGSELVLKSGLLSERSQDPASAAAVLRDDFVQRTRKALSVPAFEDEMLLATRVAERTDLERDDVYRTLHNPVGSEDALVVVAAALSSLDAQLFATTPTPRPPTSTNVNDTELNSVRET